MGGWRKYRGEEEMDVGKKCLLMAIAGVILVLTSSPFVINMVFTGKPITMFTAKEVLKPSPPQEYGPISRAITGMEKVMEVYLNPARGEQYSVSLNVVTNGTINVLVFRVNNTDMIQNSFNAGNYSVNLGIARNGTYVLNATSVDSSVVKATFKITESWLLRVMEWEEQVDLLRTVGPSVGFVVGIATLAYSLIKLRKEARAAYPKAAGETGETGYVEVEED
jgi:hypothetical protein